MRPIVEFLGDFLGFLRDRKKYWLLPLLIGLMLMGLFVFVTQTIAPLIYSVF